MKISIIWILLVVVIGCKKQDEEVIQDNFLNVMQTAASEAGAQSTAAEGAISPFASKSNDFTGCTFANVRSSCSGAVRTISWNSCTIGTLTMNGGWTETFSNATACSNFTNTGGLSSNGDSVTRTTVGSIATFLSGGTLTTDTNGGTAWDNTTINANGVTVTQGAGATRTISMDGVHRVLKGPLGTKWFDHFITGTITVNGKRSSGNRAIASGTITVYHNIAKYTASNSFSGVSWGNSICCYPTAGSITSTLTGSVAGTVSLDFTPGATTCGQATYTDTASASSTITLTHCP